jgi:hypothetical protein
MATGTVVATGNRDGNWNREATGTVRQLEPRGKLEPWEGEVGPSGVGTAIGPR